MNDHELMQSFFSNYISSLDRNHMASVPVVEVANKVEPKPVTDEALLIPEVVKMKVAGGVAESIGPTMPKSQLPEIPPLPIKAEWRESQLSPTNGWVLRITTPRGSHDSFYFHRTSEQFKLGDNPDVSHGYLSQVNLDAIRTAVILANNIVLSQR